MSPKKLHVGLRASDDECRGVHTQKDSIDTMHDNREKCCGSYIEMHSNDDPRLSPDSLYTNQVKQAPREYLNECKGMCYESEKKIETVLETPSCREIAQADPNCSQKSCTDECCLESSSIIAEVTDNCEEKCCEEQSISSFEVVLSDCESHQPVDSTIEVPDCKPDTSSQYLAKDGCFFESRNPISKKRKCGVSGIKTEDVYKRQYRNLLTVIKYFELS